MKQRLFINHVTYIKVVITLVTPHNLSQDNRTKTKMLENYNIHIIPNTTRESKKTYKQSNKLLKSNKEEKHHFHFNDHYIP